MTPNAKEVPMKKQFTFEDYREAILANPSPYAREALRAEAAACGFTAWQMAELCMAREEPWA